MRWTDSDAHPAESLQLLPRLPAEALLLDLEDLDPLHLA